MIQKIAFIGATGMLGKPVALELSKAGFRVTALVRDLTRAKKLLPDSLACVLGDIRNPADLRQLFLGQHAVYINLNLSPFEKKTDFHAETDGLQNILQVARQSGIRRIAFISSLVKNYQGMNNFHWWVFDLKEQAIRLVRESGIPYTLFYPSTFMENFEGNYRQGNRLLLAGTSEHKMYFISGSDYGRQVARSFQTLGNENKEYPVQGPEGFTADEAAREYARHYRKTKLSITKAPLGLIRFFGHFNQKMNYGAHIIEAMNRYPEKFESENTWKELGKPVTTLRDYASSR